jgi:hypothetical protein
MFIFEGAEKYLMQILFSSALRLAKIRSISFRAKGKHTSGARARPTWQQAIY